MLKFKNGFFLVTVWSAKVVTLPQENNLND